MRLFLIWILDRDGETRHVHIVPERTADRIGALCNAHGLAWGADLFSADVDAKCGI